MEMLIRYIMREGMRGKFRQTDFKLRSLRIKRNKYNKSVQCQEKNLFYYVRDMRKLSRNCIKAFIRILFIVMLFITGRS